MKVRLIDRGYVFDNGSWGEVVRLFQLLLAAEVAVHYTGSVVWLGLDCASRGPPPFFLCRHFFEISGEWRVCGVLGESCSLVQWSVRIPYSI